MSESTPTSPFSSNTPSSTSAPSHPYIPIPKTFAGHRSSPPFPPSPPSQQPPPHQAPPDRRSGGCGKFAVFGLIALLVTAILGVCLVVGSVFFYSVVAHAFDELAIERQERTLTERVIGGNARASNKIAVIRIEGVITSNADGFIARQIRQVMSDSKVKAVVLRVDSPGGTMAGSDYYLHLLNKMKTERDIPIVVSMGSMAASGGYYVSMAGDEIVAEPSTITGSIGVMASLFNVAELLDKIGVEATPITSGDHKLMGSFMKPMSEEEETLWQNFIDDNFDRFKEVVRNGRRGLENNREAWNKLTTGQIFTAREAEHYGLIDHIGFLDDAVVRAARLSGLLERDFKLIQYRPQISFLELLPQSKSPNDLLSGQALQEISTPRIYVICPRVMPVEGFR